MSKKLFPSNPYVIGVPLTGDAGFYGRRDMFVFIEDTLKAEQQNVAVLYGQRRIGKTSLLHQIARKFKDEDYVVPVYFDLQGKEQNALGKVLYALARTIARPLEMKQLNQTQFDDNGRYFHEKFLPSAYEQLGHRRLLLLFDEFDVLGDEMSSPEAASETLFPYLQELIQHQSRIVFVFVVGRRIEELTTHYHSIFKQAVYRRIGLLKKNNTRDLIVEPVKNVLTFEEGALEAILNLTGGHPYFTQLICFETFNDMKTKEQLVVSKADILDLVDQAIESGHGALNWFWDGLPRAERFIMSAVAHVTDESGLATQENIRRILEKHKIVLTGLELKDAPDRLVEWEMLHRVKKTENYRFVVELVRRWILKNHSLKSSRRDVDLISKRASRLYENARDAHTEGDLEYARDEYKRALDSNPNHSGAQLGLAQVLYELGDVEAAIEEFEKAYNIDDVSARDGLVRARLKQGKILEEAGKENEAISKYELALKIAPSNETTRRYLAAIWRKRGDAALSAADLTVSFESYQKALNLDNNEAAIRAIQDKLMAYIEQTEAGQKYDGAIKAIDQLKFLLPGNDAVVEFEIGFWTRRGDALAQEDQEGAEAIKAYQRAIELKPGDKKLTQKLESISAEWEVLLKVDRLFNKAIIAQQDKNWATAETNFLQMLKMDILDYKGRNIAALLGEAHDKLNMQTKHPSIDIQLLPQKEVVDGSNARWTITLFNNGNDYLSEVTITRDDTKEMLVQPFNLAAGKKQNLVFTSTHNTGGKKTLKIIVTAKTSTGLGLQREVNATVEMSSTKTKTPTTVTIPPPGEILSVLERFKGLTKRFYLAPFIPARKLINGRAKCKVPKTEHILGMIDFAILGSARHGLLFGEQGIYYHYHTHWTSSQPGQGAVPYWEFPNRLFRKDGKLTYIVSLDKGQILDTGGGVFLLNSADKIVEILNALKDLIIKSQ